jgi:peptidylprolyl isomerase
VLPERFTNSKRNKIKMAPTRSSGLVGAKIHANTAGCRPGIIDARDARTNRPDFIDIDEREKSMTQARHGDKVRVHYHGTLEDGTVFSSTYEEKEPFEFILGEKTVLPKFEQAIIGMNEGETKTITVSPEHAYGQHKREFVYAMDRAQAPVDLKLEVGKKLQVRSNQGKPMLATITALTEDSVILDANDPLAGRTLTFRIELIQVL